MGGFFFLSRSLHWSEFYGIGVEMAFGDFYHGGACIHRITGRSMLYWYVLGVPDGGKTRLLQCFAARLYDYGTTELVSHYSIYENCSSTYLAIVASKREYAVTGHSVRQLAGRIFPRRGGSTTSQSSAA